jgi:hypothetical protein
MLVGKFSRALEGKPKRKKNVSGKIRYQSVRDKAKQVCGYSLEVMVRITSYGKGSGNALANLGYISRTDEDAKLKEKEPLELETDRGEILSGVEAIREYARGWEADFGKPNRRRRDTVRLLMSMPPGTNPEAVKNATREFAWKAFGGRHEYVFVLHTDEPHPHCHLTVKMFGYDGTRLNIGPEDLANWREVFAQEMRDHGVDATATRRAARGVVRKAEKSVVQHIADYLRKGKTRVPKVVALRERDAVEALVAEQQGQPLPPGPWEARIRAEQDAVRSAWLAAADQLERGQTLSLLPPDHGARLRTAQVHAAAYQSGLSQRPAVDARNAPPVTSIGTTAGLRTLAQVQTVGTGRKPPARMHPIVLLPEDHHDRLKRAQQQAATYQARLATPRNGEPPRQVREMAALPRAKPARYGMYLQFHQRRPLQVPGLPVIPQPSFSLRRYEMNAPTAPITLPVYISPTLQRLAVPLPEPSPACASCPASMWYIAPHQDGQQLKCFCKSMHVITWDYGLEPILHCDGKELGLLEIAEALAANEERRIDRAERKAEQARREADRQADRAEKKREKDERKADRKVPAKSDPTEPSAPPEAS